jgi:hypothetical protein
MKDDSGVGSTVDAHDNPRGGSLSGSARRNRRWQRAANRATDIAAFGLPGWLGIYWRWLGNRAASGRELGGARPTPAATRGRPDQRYGFAGGMGVLAGQVAVTIGPGTPFVLPLVALTGEPTAGRSRERALIGENPLRSTRIERHPECRIDANRARRTVASQAELLDDLQVRRPLARRVT